MLLLHHLPHGAGMPLLSPSGGQDYLGEQVASGEKHLRACGQLRGQLCLLMQQVADLLLATSRGAWPPGAQVGASCACQQAVPASTLCMPRTLRRELECHIPDQAKKGCLCHPW